MSVMELGHLLTRSGLTYLEISSEVCHDSFCQLGNSVSFIEYNLCTIRHGCECQECDILKYDAMYFGIVHRRLQFQTNLLPISYGHHNTRV